MQKVKSVKKEYQNIKNEINNCDILLQKSLPENEIELTLQKRDSLFDTLQDLAEQICKK
jgi:hypothetical protein